MVDAGATSTDERKTLALEGDPSRLGKRNGGGGTHATVKVFVLDVFPNSSPKKMLVGGDCTWRTEPCRLPMSALVTATQPA